MTTLTLKLLVCLAFFAGVTVLMIPSASAEATNSVPAATASLETAKEDSTAKLPPGDIKGTVTEADGATANPDMSVTLKNATTGEALMSTTTNDKGEYVLKDVKEGTYVVQVGSAGFSAMLTVANGAAAGSLDIMIPRKVALMAVGTWVAEYPVLTAVLAAGSVVLVAAPIIAHNNDDDSDHHKKKTIIESPTSP